MSSILELIFYFLGIFSKVGWLKALVILITILIIAYIISVIYVYVIKPKNSSSNQITEPNQLY
jgi:hypothetical protein